VSGKWKGAVLSAPFSMSAMVVVNPDWVGSEFCFSPKDNCIVVEVDIPKTSFIEELVDEVWVTPDLDSGSKTITVKSNKMNTHN
tara:strand:- start:37 stop:288 length:252 start_codon:yes stop_codon:yes gene_type:complete